MRIPTFGYPGGKAKLRKWLVPMFPRSGRGYIEPFAGRGNVYFLARTVLSFESWALNDIFTAPFLRAVRDVNPGDIPNWIPPGQSVKMARASEDPNGDPVMILLGTVTQFSSGVARSGSSPMMCRDYLGTCFRTTIRTAQRMMQDVTIAALDWRALTWDTYTRDDFAYIDPPYMNNNAGYMINMPDEMSHRRLLTTLKKTRCRWLLSGYDTPLYRNLLGSPIASVTVARTMSFAGRQNDTRPVECVWTNYDVSDA